MLVKVDQFIFQTNFVILDFEIDSKIHIILGRPFLATGRVLGKVESGEQMIRVNKNEVTFNVCKSMKNPSNIYVLSTIYVVDDAVASVSNLMQVVLAYYYEN